MSCFTEEKRKARKYHRCSWCCEIIEKGEEYYYQSGVGDEGPFDSKLHKVCREATESIPYEEWENYEEMWGHAAKGHVHENGWGEMEACPGCDNDLPQ